MSSSFGDDILAPTTTLATFKSLFMLGGPVFVSTLFWYVNNLLAILWVGRNGSGANSRG
jgi:hypothetical protein